MSDLGSQTNAVRLLNMSSAPRDVEKLLARLEAAVQRLEAKHSFLPLALTIKAAAQQLSVSERTMRTLVASGEVPSVLVGGRRMVPSAELLKLAQPAELVMARRKRTTNKPAGMDLDAELERAERIRARVRAR